MSFVKEVTVPKKPNLNAEAKRKLTEEYKKQHAEDSKIVKGIFKNIECSGASVEFTVKLYKDDPIRTYNLKDGESYSIPHGIAKHINKQCKYKRSKHLIDKNGNSIITSDKPRERYQFTSTDFM